MNNGLAYWKERKLDSLRGIVKFLKGVWHEIFSFKFFFLNQCSPGLWVSTTPTITEKIRDKD